MASSSSSASTALPTYDHVQLGSVARPAQLVRNGFPSDQGKRCTSAQILLRDPRSIAYVQSVESELEAKAPAGHTLHSSVIRTVDEADYTYPVIRCKFTRDDSNYTCRDPWGDSAASGIDQLEFGHQILGVFRPVAWKRDGNVGIVFYCNRIRCGGKSETPVGGYVQEEIQWQ